MSLAHALSGIRVLDLTRLLPGPYLTMVLADMGADVVKVEAPNIGDYLRLMPPTRAGMSARFLAINRNKRSLALNLKQPAGRDALLRMVERADVVVESFRPGVMARLGLDYDTLRARQRGIVLCSISGYGQTGPYRDRAGHDLDYIALGGGLSLTGERDRAPVVPGFQIADLAGGALWGTTGILAALVQRARTGEGTHLDISMTEGALALLAAEFGNWASAPAEAAPPRRGDAPLHGGLACYRVYRAGDGKFLAVAALEPKFWLALNQALGRKASAAELAAPAERQEHIAAELSAIFAARSRDEWAQLLAEHDCCCEPVLELDEVTDHPLHRAREVFFELPAEPGGEAPLAQVRTPLGAPAERRWAPALGEHSQQVLAEYGFDHAEIERLLSTAQ